MKKREDTKKKREIRRNRKKINEKERKSDGRGKPRAVLFRIRRFARGEDFPVSRLPRLENLRRTAFAQEWVRTEREQE